MTTPPDQHTEILIAIARIEGKLDQINNNLTVHGKAIDDHETRLRAVEKKVWRIPSAVGIVAVAGLIVAVLALPQVNHSNNPNPSPTVTVTSTR